MSLNSINRVIIALLTCVGLVIDGYHAADVLFALAVFIWLWLPECDRHETRLLKWLSLRFRMKSSSSSVYERR